MNLIRVSTAGAEHRGPPNRSAIPQPGHPRSAAPVVPPHADGVLADAQRDADGLSIQHFARQPSSRRTSGFKQVAATNRLSKAIITGGAKGLGAVIAQRLASEGIAVSLLDMNEAGAKETAEKITVDTGSPAYGFRCDVTDRVHGGTR